MPKMKDPKEAKVYLLNTSPNKDYSAALQYGEMVVLNNGSYNVFNVPALVKDIAEKLKDFDSKKDYLLIAGSPFVTGIAMVELFGRFEQINVLLFEAKNKDYVIRYVKGSFFDAVE